GMSFEAIVDQLIEGVLVNGPDGRVLYVNEALATLLRYDRHEMLGCTIFDWMDDEGRSVSRAKLAERRHGAIDRFDFRFVRSDGTSVWTRVSARPVYGPDGTHHGSLVSVTDISGHVALEKALEASSVRAIAASEAKTAFLANMSHELRTPLNAIVGYVEMVLEEPAEAVATCASDLDRVLKSASHLLELIDDVLDLSRIEAGQMRVQLAPFDVLATLRETVRWMSANARQHVLQSDFEDLPDEFSSDARRIRQVVINLLSNAIKYSAPGTVTIEATGDSDRLTIRVRDEGPGIEPARLESIFHPFHRGELPVHRRVGGTGLGLTISRRVARHLGGDLTVESAPGQGSTFIFTVRNQPQEHS
ncbi:MAG: ATP-binding protein, partial [Myxococcota bacterium]